MKRWGVTQEAGDRKARTEVYEDTYYVCVFICQTFSERTVLFSSVHCKVLMNCKLSNEGQTPFHCCCGWKCLTDWLWWWQGKCNKQPHLQQLLFIQQGSTPPINVSHFLTSPSLISLGCMFLVHPTLHFSRGQKCCQRGFTTGSVFWLDWIGIVAAAGGDGWQGVAEWMSCAQWCTTPCSYKMLKYF